MGVAACSAILQRSNGQRDPLRGRGNVRFNTKLFKSGSSQHLTVFRPLLEATGWKHGEDLVILVQPDRSVRILTLDAYMDEYHKQRVAAERVEPAGVRS
jgi:hypothetical protein